MKTNNELLDFYLKTSMYTDLGLYKDFAKDLPNDINELCLLQRRQIIHPFFLKENQELSSKMPLYYRVFEDDLFPTGISMLSELLRRNKNYNDKREEKDKIHVTCRGQSILLTSILKAKGIPARCRCGFGYYVSDIDGSAGDHWIVEYYNKLLDKWILVDPDFHDYDIDTNVDSNNITAKDFLLAPKAYLGIRNGSIKETEIYFASSPYVYGLKTAIRYLLYDFNCLMNNEIFFLYLPKFVIKADLDLNEEELKELDVIAELMLRPNDNFKKIKSIWDTNDKFKITGGGFN